MIWALVETFHPVTCIKQKKKKKKGKRRRAEVACSRYSEGGWSQEEV
jgi:hypothetical protein